jgi:hypothetical protein
MVSLAVEDNALKLVAKVSLPEMDVLLMVVAELAEWVVVRVHDNSFVIQHNVYIPLLIQLNWGLSILSSTFTV